MTIWFTADTHFGEQPKARQRAAELSAEQLDALIEQRWRETVEAGDIVWHLGDVGDWRRLADLPGVKHLVFGNNDKGRRKITDSLVLASTATSHRLQTATGMLLLIHDPAHAGADGSNTVVHGHLHALPSPAPNFISVSIDRHDWRPLRAAQVAPGA